MYSKTSAVSRTIRNMVMGLGRGGGQSGSGVLQHDLEHHLAGVAGAVDRRLDQVVEFHENDHFLGVVGSVVEVLDEGEHDLVGLALGELQARLGVLDAVDLRALAQLLDHEVDGVDRLDEQHDLALHTLARHAGGADGQALDQLLDRLGNAVKGEGEGLDVLALERRDERLAELLGDLLGDALVLAPGVDDVVEVRGADRVVVLEDLGEQLGAHPGFLGTGFQQVVEFLFLAQELLEGDHARNEAGSPGSGEAIFNKCHADSGKDGWACAWSWILRSAQDDGKESTYPLRHPERSEGSTGKTEAAGFLTFPKLGR